MAGAPFGNKNAVGNNGGAPRKHNREQIAKDLIEWAKKEDSINLNKFCALYEPPFPATDLYDWSEDCIEFRRAVEIAKSYIAFRREEWLAEGKLHVKCYEITSTNYDLLNRRNRTREKREDLEHAKELATHKAQTDARIVDEDAQKRHDALMEAITQKQSKTSLVPNHLPKPPEDLKIRCEGDIAS